MDSFRTIFFPRYPEKRDDRTKAKCDSANSADSNYDRYKRNFVDRDANRRQIAMTSDQSS